MKENWWKILGVLLVLGACIGGFLIPLGPGISSVDPIKSEGGKDVQLKVTGYNTHFAAQNLNMKAWLIRNVKGEAQLSICLKEVKVLNDGEAMLSFHLPSNSPSAASQQSFSLIMNNDEDGTTELMDAFIIDYSKKTAGDEFDAACKPIVKTNKSTIFSFPNREILNETIRNLFFHVTMWFSMFLLFGISVYNSIMYLWKEKEINDIRASEFVNTGVLFGICGLITGSLWARFTWGAWWVIKDPQLNGAAIVMLEYFAYLILRGSIQEEKSRAKVSAVYNIFAAASIIPLLFLLPRQNDSLHPGKGGNTSIKQYDLDNHLRIFFYTAGIGFMILGYWLAQLRVRIKKMENAIFENC